MSDAVTLGFTISNGTITKHSLTDYGLAVANTNYIGEPTMETYTVDVPGRAGILDLSTALTGYPVFKSRMISISVGALKPIADWDAFMSDLRNNFAGKKCKIIFDNDTDWYWEGIVLFTTFDRYRNLGTFNIDMTADAYKYKVTLAVDTYNCNNQTKSVTIRNTYAHPVTPYFNCIEGPMTISVTLTGQATPMTFTLNSGHGMEVPGLDSKTTNMSVSVGTTGTMKVTWREMSL